MKKMKIISLQIKYHNIDRVQIERKLFYSDVLLECAVEK